MPLGSCWPGLVQYTEPIAMDASADGQQKLMVREALDDHGVSMVTQV